MEVLRHSREGVAHRHDWCYYTTDEGDPRLLLLEWISSFYISVLVLVFNLPTTQTEGHSGGGGSRRDSPNLNQCKMDLFTMALYPKEEFC